MPVRRQKAISSDQFFIAFVEANTVGLVKFSKNGG